MPLLLHELSINVACKYSIHRPALFILRRCCVAAGEIGDPETAVWMGK